MILKKSVKSINPCKSVIQTSYNIVKTHGGKISVKSKQKNGTAIIINLPINQ